VHRTTLLLLIALAAAAWWCAPASAQTAQADFDGDGFADLAIGVPFQDVSGQSNAGAVCVVYGDSTGFTDESVQQVWNQDSGSGLENAEANDRFGSALATGDFNGDGFADLAVGVPFEDVDALVDAGAVNVIYGSPAGLSETGNQFWHQGSTDINDEPEQGDQFGSVLTAANFGKSSRADLAVGVPFEDVEPILNAGAVNVIYGTSTGLAASGDQFWHQNRRRLAETAEEDDRFGSALAAANFGKSSHADLAVGVPFETNGGVSAAAGAVNVLYGTSTGLSARGDQLWHQNRRGIAETAEAEDLFGAALAAANFGKSSHADLAVGVRNEDVGAAANAGAVNVIFGTSSGLAAAGDQIWHQDSRRIDDVAEGGDGFGVALAATNLGRSGHADLAVGVPFEDVGTVVDSGSVNVLYGTSTGLAARGDQVWHQNSKAINDAAEEVDAFGRALGAANFGSSSHSDLAVGVPVEDMPGELNAGAVNVIYGTSGGLSAFGDDFLDETFFGGTHEAGDQFGDALAPRR
jgi:hypothetical protein